MSGTIISTVDRLIEHYRTLPISIGRIFVKEANWRRYKAQRQGAGKGFPLLPQIALDRSLRGFDEHPYADTYE
jgi:hypothetical protein